MRHPKPTTLALPSIARAILLASAILIAAAPVAHALITGGEGNEPIENPRWPAGAAAVFNLPARIAYWVGPPFGGGQWHGEFRGATPLLNATLADFAKVDVKDKRLVIHDGVGHSFWLNPNREATKTQSSRIDWVVVVWEDDAWQRVSQFAVGLRPGDVDPEGGPVASIDVFAGGSVNWADVEVPEGLEVIDERLEAHGFALTDGVVLEGDVVDLADRKPIPSRIELQRIEPQSSGGYRYTSEREIDADASGHWLLKSVPEGRYRLVASADGYAPRVVGHIQTDAQPGWQHLACGLSRTATIEGTVTDEASKPLSGVQVRLSDVADVDGARYELLNDEPVATDDSGRFQIQQAPIGTARIRIHKVGYCTLGLRQPDELPGTVALTMTRSAQITVTVNFAPGARPDEYLVEIEPEGGTKIGSWGGSGQIDAENRIVYRDVPPGRYRLTGKPNPSRAADVSPPRIIDLIGGEDLQITLDPASGK